MSGDGDGVDLGDVLEVDTTQIGNYLDLGGEGGIQDNFPDFWLTQLGKNSGDVF